MGAFFPRRAALNMGTPGNNPPRPAGPGPGARRAQRPPRCWQRPARDRPVDSRGLLKAAARPSPAAHWQPACQCLATELPWCAMGSGSAAGVSAARGNHTSLLTVRISAPSRPVIQSTLAREWLSRFLLPLDRRRRCASRLYLMICIYMISTWPRLLAPF